MTGVGVDLHCHVLPGVDDGAETVEDSLAFLRAAAAGGTGVVVATPHQHPGRYPNPPGPLRAAHEALLRAREETGEDLPEVLLGAEVHLDHDLPARIAAGELLTLAGTDFLLLELPDVFAWPVVEETVYRLRLVDVTPIVAHPERCGQILREPQRLQRLVALGALAQVTGSSIAGDFGEPCRAVTEGFLREGLVHFVASDAHDVRRRTASLVAARTAVRDVLGPEGVDVLFELNPRAVIAGGDIRTLPAAPAAAAGRRSVLDRLGWRRRR